MPLIYVWKAAKFLASFTDLQQREGLLLTACACAKIIGCFSCTISHDTEILSIPLIRHPRFALKNNYGIHVQTIILKSYTELQYS